MKQLPITKLSPVLRTDFSDDAAWTGNLYDGLGSGVGGEFRALPSEVQAIENNLSIANMDFGDFASTVDGGGVFRGF
jgi:hypothetical protein